jgi:hypothetical protein
MYIGASKSVKIAPYLDLNDLTAAHFQLPVREERRLRLGMGGSGSSGGPHGTTTTTAGAAASASGRKVILRVHLERMAFVPQQPVPFHVAVDNRSGLTLKGVRVHFNSVRTRRNVSRIRLLKMCVCAAN